MLTLDQFKEARGVLRGVISDTELVHSPYFSDLCGNEVYLKPENLQVTGAYKIRGAYYKTSLLSEEQKARGLITASAGNHAQGVAYAAKVIQGLIGLSARGESIHEQNVRYLIQLVKSGNEDKIQTLAADVLCVTAKGKPVKAKTVGQKKYVDAIRANTVTLGVGPAGTGKTYLAVAAAVAAFRAKEVNRIILTRPAVEAGERLGFLPGDLQSKVDPYLRPLYDALFDMLGAETYQKYLERGNIEVAPLAYMRGRTLDDSFIILDEAQNTSREQMKMFLTRMGFGSKMVITGDITQIDLPGDKPSGLKDAMKILKGVEGVSICQLTQQDVVRHVMVQRIIEAYARFEEKRK